MTGIEKEEVLTTHMEGTRERGTEEGGGQIENATILHHAILTTCQASTPRGTVFPLRRVDTAIRVGVVLEGEEEEEEEEEGGTGDTHLQEDKVLTNVCCMCTPTHMHASHVHILSTRAHTHAHTHTHTHTRTHSLRSCCLPLVSSPYDLLQ